MQVVHKVHHLLLYRALLRGAQQRRRRSPAAAAGSRGSGATSTLRCRGGAPVHDIQHAQSCWAGGRGSRPSPGPRAVRVIRQGGQRDDLPRAGLGLEQLPAALAGAFQRELGQLDLEQEHLHLWQGKNGK